jgi:hypothetical protein
MGGQSTRRAEKSEGVSMTFFSEAVLNMKDPRANKKCRFCKGRGRRTVIHVDDYSEYPVSVECFCIPIDADRMVTREMTNEAIAKARGTA